MAAGLSNQFTAATTASFQQKVSIALVVSARAVKAEATVGMPASKIRKRQQLADTVIALPGSATTVVPPGWTPSALTLSVAYALASAGFDDASTDAAIQSAIGNNWDVLAGFGGLDN